MTRVKLLLWAGLLGTGASVPAWYAACQPRPPQTLTALAEAAAAAGYRVVPVADSTKDPAQGFWAVPPGDTRGWEEVSALTHGRPGWGGAVLALRGGPDVETSDPPAYRGAAYLLYGELTAVQDLAGTACLDP